MNRFARVAARITFYAGMVAALALSAMPSGARTAVAQETTRSINGHSVSGRFLQVWSSHGSDQSNIYVNGLPVTDRRAEISMTDGKTYDTQWFERARYEAHPDKQAPYDVLLGLLGVTLTEGRGLIDPTTKQARDPSDQAFVKIAKPADADGKTKVLFQETGHSVSGKILEYWNKYGGLQQFGFPLSEQFQEVSPTDGKQYTVQYFERNRFELHPEKAAPYEVELGLLGVQQYRTQPIAADQLPVNPPKGVKSSKDALVLGVGQEPATLLSIYEGEASGLIDSMLFNGSVNVDYKGDLAPGDLYYVPLLENGGAYFVGQGGDRHLVMKEKIRFGLHWSDGVPVTSSDWIYTFKLITDPKSGLDKVGRGFLRKLYSADNPDANTVIYNFMSYNQALALYNKPGQDPDLMATLKPYVDSNSPVTDTTYYFCDGASDGGTALPEHILGNTPAEKVHESAFARAPIGDGPFKIDHWDIGAQMVLIPNPYYSLTTPPLLKRIVVKFIADFDEAMAQLKAGDLDAVPYAGNASDWQAFDALPASSLTVVYSQIHGYEQINFNLDRPQFHEKAVRQAIVTGIDRQNIVDTLFGHKTVILNTFLPPRSWASMDNAPFAEVWRGKYPINRYTFDPVNANNILDAAGWTKGSDGIRAKNGVKLVFGFSTTKGNDLRAQISRMVAADLKKIGMQVNLEYIPGSTFFADEGTLAKRQFDLAEYTWLLPDEPSGILYDSRSIPSPDNNYTGDNHPGFKNDRFDQLSRMADLELEHAKRAPLFAEMQQIWNDELPEIPLFSTTSVSIHRSNLVNWFDSGDEGSNAPTYTIAAMYFK